jgi:hypothetical protein
MAETMNSTDLLGHCALFVYGHNTSEDIALQVSVCISAKGGHGKGKIKVKLSLSLTN